MLCAMASGKSSALAQNGIFQPWMQFPAAGWVKSALLLRERIDRMVPASSGKPDLTADNDLRILAEHGLIGDYVVTNGDADDAEQVALDRLDAALESGVYWQWVEAGRPFAKDRQYTRIHNEKIGDYFAGKIGERSIASEEHGGYLYTDPAVVALYMFTLAQILQNKITDSCLVSDARGYAALATLVGSPAPRNDGDPLLTTLLVGLSIDLNAVTSMPTEEFAAWHRENASLRSGLRVKLAEIGAEPQFLQNRLQAAQDEFNRYVTGIPPARRFSVNRALAFIGVALPFVGMALDLAAGTAGLGTLVTVPAGAALSGAALARRHRATEWERYLVEIAGRRTRPAPDSQDAMANLLAQISPLAGR